MENIHNMNTEAIYPIMVSSVNRNNMNREGMYQCQRIANNIIDRSTEIMITTLAALATLITHYKAVWQRGHELKQRADWGRCFVYTLMVVSIITLPASATVHWYPDTDAVFIYSDTPMNLSELHTILVSAYNETYVNENILNETSPNVWTLHTTIRPSSGTSFYINNSDCTRLNLTDGYSGESFYGGDWYINDVTIDGGVNKRGIRMGNGSVVDSVFMNIATIYTNGNHNGIFENLAFTDCGTTTSRVLNIQYSDNITI